MYRILVVDDEPIAVESVVVMINRNFPGLFTVGSCRSGKMAIEMAGEQHPDVVIMDIDMPGINGLEAIKRIKETQRDVTFVILSAFDYFSYAQEALSLGVVEYLVKPVKEAKLVEVLEGVLAGKESSSNDKRKMLDQQERLLMSMPVLEKNFCETAARGGEYSEELRGACELLGFADTGGYILLFRPEAGAAQSRLDFHDFRLGLKNTYDFVMGQLRYGDIVLYVLAAENGPARAREAAGIARRFLDYAAQKGLAFVCGVGGWQDTAAKAGVSFAEAKNAVTLAADRYVRQKYGPVLDAASAAQIDSRQTENQAEYMEKYLSMYLDKEDPADIMHEYRKLIALEQGKNTPFRELRNIVADLELKAGRHFDIPVDLTRGNVDSLLGTADTDALEAAVAAAVARNADYLVQRYNKSDKNLIETAREYIQAHYAEAVTLEDVAKNANLSQYYFSRIFKQETGAGFMDFLTKVRIDNSKKLLMMEDISIKEVAYMVGFNDPNYFSKAFKKATGQTPGEYKKG